MNLKIQYIFALSLEIISIERKAIKEGQWYNKREILYQQLNQLYQQNINQEQQNKNIKFIISPHAGLEYCQNVQASAFSNIKLQNFDSVIILGVCHCFSLKQLGQSPFKYWDGIFVDKLECIDTPFKKVNQQSCQKEHSIEILIPFLSLLMKEQQRKLPIIPIYCGSKPTQQDIQQLKQIQQSNNSLIIISSDFCHYGYNFDYQHKIKGKTYDQTIDILNMQAVDTIKQGPTEFYQNILQTGNTVCGLFSIYTGLQLFDNYQAELTLYQKSGSIESIYDSSVSYCGIIGY